MQFRTISEIRSYLEASRQRLEKARYPQFHYVLKQVWKTLRSIPETSTILNAVKGQSLGSSHAQQLTMGGAFQEGSVRIPENENVHFDMCVITINHILEFPLVQHQHDRNAMVIGERLGTVIRSPIPGRGTEEPEKWRQQLETFFFYIIEPIFDHLSRQLETRSAMLSLLKRYKNKVELFCRRLLTDRIERGLVKPEREAKLHLYEYLHDNRVVYYVEPTMGEGEADLVGGQGDDPLIADAKMFDDDKRAVTKGFAQVYQYTDRYSVSVGYLVIYNQSNQDLVIEGDDIDDHVRFVRHGGKTIYFIIIQTHPEPMSPSLLKPLKSHVVTRAAIASELEQPFEA